MNVKVDLQNTLFCFISFLEHTLNIFLAVCMWPVLLHIMCLAGICPNCEELFLQSHDYSGNSEHKNGHVKGERNAIKLVIFQSVFYG